jgi:ribulose-bisphosphate carboxylase large chain
MELNVFNGLGGRKLLVQPLPQPVRAHSWTAKDVGGHRAEPAGAANAQFVIDHHPDESPCGITHGCQLKDLSRPRTPCSICWVLSTGRGLQRRRGARGERMTEVVTAVYEITGDDPVGRAALVAVEQSHELPTELAPDNAVRDSLAHVRTVVERPGRPALATVDYPVDLAGGELGQLLVLLLGNVSLQDGVRLVDVTLPASLAAALPGPRLGVPGIRTLVGEPERPLLATALKPVGMTSEQLADLAYDVAAGGLHVVKEDQGLADQPWAPFAERVPRLAEAVRRANDDTGGRSVYLPAVNGAAAHFADQVRYACDAGAHGVLVMPGIAGFGALSHAAGLFDGGIVLAHPSFLGGFTAAASHGIAPDVLLGTLLRLAGADASIFPSWGGRFSLSRQECLAIADACRRPLHGLPPVLPTPGGGMSIDRAPELLAAYGPDTLFLVGGDLRRGGDPRRAAERLVAATWA